jgi:hypothetical protein
MKYINAIKIRFLEHFCGKNWEKLVQNVYRAETGSGPGQTLFGSATGSGN